MIFEFNKKITEGAIPATIINKISKAWNQNTAHPSYKNKWSADNPSAGQCAITALIINDLYGYDIYDTIVGKSRHFFNKDDTGNVVDLTKEQFTKPVDYSNSHPRNRKDLLKSADVKARYELLKSRLSDISKPTLTEAKFIDSENKYQDFGTGVVTDDNIYDNRTHTSFYDQLLTNPKYMEEHENLKGEIVMMSPNEYYSECASKVFNNRTSVEKLKASRAADKGSINTIKELITKYKRQIFLPYINYAEQGQEGLHGMMVAGDLFGWDHKFPVLVINWADEATHEAEEREKANYKTQVAIEKAVKRSLEYEYETIDEFKTQLSYDLPRAFYSDEDIPFELSENNNSYIITVNSVSYDFDKDALNIVEHTADDLDDIEVSPEQLDDLKNLDIDSFMRKYFS